MANELLDEFLGGGSSAKTKPSIVQSSSLLDEFLTPSETQSKSEKTTTENLTGGLVKGVLNVANTLKGSTDYLSEGIGKLIGAKGTEGTFERGQESIKKQNKLYEQEYGDSTAAEVGKVGGEIAASAPLLPVRGIQVIRGAMGALPTVLSTGEKVSAPLVNRLMASSATGAVGGGTYGAATSAGNDKSLIRNIGENALGGAVGGPILDRAGALASKIIPSAGTILGNAKVNTIASRYGINPKAAKQILTELENEGMTVAEAEAQINKLGPDATIADLTPALQKMAGALGQRGGRATSIVENRFATRADASDDTAHNIMVSKLGIKPNLENEKEAVIKEAQRLTSADYTAAHANPQKLDISGTVSHIDDALQNAVGTEAKALKEVKGYLYKTVKDAQGNTSEILKDDIKGLHKVRQGLDDMLDRLPKEGTSQKSHTYRAVKNVRDLVDTQLKTNSQMSAADAKFAEKMKISEGLDIGYKALNKGNFEQFERIYNTSAPEVQETIKKGLRAQIGDMMESAARGELAGAQQLLGKKSANRKKLELVFGQKGIDVLDALEAQASLRGTEKAVATGSRTAVNQRINALFDNPHPKGIVADALTGLALDATSGSLGTGTAIMAAKRTGGNILTRFGESRKDKFAEGTADLISQSGLPLKSSMLALKKINTVQNRLKINPGNLELPVTASSVVGSPLLDYQNYKNIKDRF